MPCSAQLAPVPFQVKLQRGIGAEVIHTHHAIGNVGIGRERGDGLAFRHVHPHRRRGSGYAQPRTVVRMVNIGDRDIQSQVRLERIGLQQHRQFVDIQPFPLDDGLNGTAFRQLYGCLHVGDKLSERVEHCQVLQRNNGVDKRRVRNGRQHRLCFVYQPEQMHRALCIDGESLGDQIQRCGAIRREVQVQIVDVKVLARHVSKHVLHLGMVVHVHPLR